MARDHGRIFASIWSDPDFITCTPGAQRLYAFLLTQADLSHVGVVAMRLRRWATRAAGLTVADLERDLDELAAARFIVVDHDTEEVLVRSFVRNDGVWRSPNVMKAAVKDAREILSDALRTALTVELERLPLNELTDESRRDAPSVREVVSTCVETLLEELSNPSGNPSGNPSRNPAYARIPSPSPSTTTGVDPSSEIADAIADGADDPTQRPEVIDLCEHLADRIEANGSRRPRIGKRWHTAARLLLDVDGRTPGQVRAAIDWSQDDPFWRANILSMPKLREKYDQLRLAAQRQQTPARPGDRQLEHLRDAYEWAQQEDAAHTPAIGAP